MIWQFWAGPADLAAVDLAVRRGLNVALLERGCLGGNSLNAGSVPSKALIHAARVFTTLRRGEELAASVPTKPRIAFVEIMARMRRIRTRIAEYQSVERLCAQGADVFFGDACFAGPNTLTVDGAQLSFKKALVATGARPRQGDIPGLPQIGYFTSESIFDIDALPKWLAIIGGGPLGCELAQAFCRLGSHVTIVQRDPKLLPHEDRNASEILAMALSRDGVEMRLNTTVVGARGETREKWIDTVNNGVKSSILVDEILLTIGRMPNVDSLRLDVAGIDSDAIEGAKVDDYMRTTNVDVYAAGDVCNVHKFTNIAEASARIAVLNALGRSTERQKASDDSVVHLLRSGGGAHRHARPRSESAINPREKLHGGDAGCRSGDY